MGAPIKFPLFATLKLTLRWTKAIVVRHWGVVLTYLVISFLPSGWMALWPETAAAAGPSVIDLMIFCSSVVAAVAYVYFALLTYHEVLIGPAGFNQQTIGPFGVRFFTYIFDYFIAVVMTLILMLLVVIALFVVLHTFRPFIESIFGILGVFAVLGASVMGVLLISRLTLRLPCRAVGRPLPWRDVWHMGRGNSWRLFYGPLLLLLLLVLPVALIAVPLALSLPHSSTLDVVRNLHSIGVLHFQAEFVRSTEGSNSSLLQLIMGSIMVFVFNISNPLMFVLLSAFEALAYAQLQDNLAPSRRGSSADRSDTPPWDYDDDYR